MSWEFVANVRGNAGPVGDWYKGVIPNGSDFNDFTGTADTGLYAVLGQSDAATMSNIPEDFAGSLLVLPVGSGASQEYTPYYWPPRKWIRNSAPSTGTGWTEWRRVSMGGDLKHDEIPAGTDLDDIYGDGMEGTHPVLLASTAATLLNLPPDLEKEPRAFVLFAKTLNDGTIQEIDTYYWPPRKYIRNSAPSTGTSWTAWRTILMDGDVSASGGGGASNGFKTVPLAVTLPASSSTTESIAAASLRFPLKYGAPIHRGALHIQNRNIRGDITYTGAVSFTGVWFGEGNHTTGAFMGTPKQVHGAFTTPADGDEKVLPFSNLLAMEPDKEYLLSVGFTNAAGQDNTLSYGAVWRSTNPGNASLVAPAQTKGKEAPFNFWIEAQTFGDTPVIATVASSGGAGIGSTLPILESSLSIICRRLGALPIHYAHSGSTLAIWDDAEHIKWQQWIGQARPDAALLALGSNDVFGSATLDEIKADFLDVAKIITDTQTPNLFLTTIPPRSYAGDDTKRLAFNAWMKTLPGGAVDIFDYSEVLTSPDGLLRPEFDADGTHANTAGAEAVAATVDRPIVGHLAGRSVATLADLPDADTGNRGLIVYVIAENEPYYSNGTIWTPVATGAQGPVGPVGPGVPEGGSAFQLIRKNSANTTTEWATPDRAMVGLGNVDNTPDATKPVSTAQAAEIAKKVGKWLPSTAYTAGELRIAPSGDVLKAAANHTAGTVFDSVLWERVLDPALRQAVLYGSFMKKLRTGIPATINCMGDSTTYGHDTVSADKVAAPTEALPDGTFHADTRSPAPFPSVLQAKLTEVYPAGVTVINRGRSGDTATRAMFRWPTSSGADLTIISFGINDASANGNVDAGDLAVFIKDYDRIIRRELNDYNAAVVILTPMKQSLAAGNTIVDVFRNALEALATKYGIPIIDMQEFLAGYDNSVYSDPTHLNTKGNSIVGAKLAACFIGKGPYHRQHVSSGTRMSVRPTIDNVAYVAPAAITTATGGGTPTEDTANTANIVGKVNTTTTAGAIYYSFYADINDLVVIPNYNLPTNGTLTVSLDFGVEQPHDVMNALVGQANSTTYREPGSFTHATTSASAFNSGVVAGLKAIRIASPGWHTLKITGSSPDGTIILHALEFLNYRAWSAGIAPVIGPSFHLPVPPNFSSTTTTLTTRVKVADVLARLGIPDWGAQIYKAPAWKITIRSFGQRVIEYILSADTSPTGGTTIDKLVEIRNTPLITTPNETWVHEIQSVTWDNATKEWIFTWKTLLADGTTARDMTRNFVMEISVL